MTWSQGSRVANNLNRVSISPLVSRVGDAHRGSSAPFLVPGLLPVSEFPVTSLVTEGGCAPTTLITAMDGRRAWSSIVHLTLT